MAFVAHVNETVHVSALTLKASRNGTSHSLSISIASKKSNEVAAVLAPGNLSVLGVTQAGKYMFAVLEGAKQLGKGTLTEK